MPRSEKLICGTWYGTTFTATKWRSLLPIGLICISLSVAFHVSSLLVLGLSFVSYDDVSRCLYYILYVPCSVLALCSLFKTWVTDPGTVPLGARPLEAHLERMRNRAEAARAAEGGRRRGSFELGDYKERMDAGAERGASETCAGGHRRRGEAEGRDDAETAVTALTEGDMEVEARRDGCEGEGGREYREMSERNRRRKLRKVLALVPTRFQSIFHRRHEKSLLGMNDGCNTAAAYDGKNDLSSDVHHQRNEDADDFSVAGHSTAVLSSPPTPTSSRRPSLVLSAIGKMLLSSQDGDAAVQLPIRRCTKCDGNYKPPRAHHDRITGRCIVKLDHYCPWVCNAIGVLNHKHFFLFVLYTFLCSALSAVLLRRRYVRCGYDIVGGFYTGTYNWYVAGCQNPSSWDVGALCILTAWFLCFSGCMLCGQWEAVRGGASKIARLKMREEKERRIGCRKGTRVGANVRKDGAATKEGMDLDGKVSQERAGGLEAGVIYDDNEEDLELGMIRTDFNEMFGGKSGSFAWHWLVPTDVKFPDGAFDEVMGFSYDDPQRNPYLCPRRANSQWAERGSEWGKGKVVTNVSMGGALLSVATNRRSIDQADEIHGGSQEPYVELP